MVLLTSSKIKVTLPKPAKGGRSRLVRCELLASGLDVGSRREEIASSSENRDVHVFAEVDRL
jgi:hypothetical protein